MLLAFYSGVAMLYGSLAAERNDIKFLAMLNREFPRELELLSYDPDPFQDVHRIHFLEPAEYKFLHIEGAAALEAELERRLTNGGSAYVFSLPRGWQPLTQRLKKHCSVHLSALPVWLTRFNIGGWVQRAANYTLYQCKT